MTTQGILLLSDSNQENLLPFWWNHYSQQASYPITFIDIGMSENAKTWCRSKGTLLSLSLPSPAPKSEIDPELAQFWEEAYPGPIWELRPAWFAKPLALKLSPYTYTLFFDLDCLIQKPIDALFDYAKEGFAIVKHVLDIGIFHNSGVIAYKKGSPTLQGWIDTCKADSHLHLGDDDVLRHLIDHKIHPFTFFPIDFNCPDMLHGSENAAICHFLGPHGKQKILSSV